MSAKKVLHVSESNEWSGGAAQLLALAEGLRERKWDVRIGCRPGSGLAKHSADRKLPRFEVALREDYDVLSARKLAQYVAREKIDVVHAHHNRSHAVCLLAQALLALAGRPVVLVVSRRVSFPPGRNPFSRWKYRSALIDRIVAVADGVKDVLVASGVPAAKVEVVRSGVDVERFKKRAPDAALRKELGLPADRPVIAKIANASPWKGQTVLIEAAGLLLSRGRKAHFLLAGRDTQSAWIKDEVEKRGLSGAITLAGFRTDVPDLLSLVDVSVNAATQGEGLSGALRESLASGVPVVASDVAGNRELLKSGVGGWLYPPGDAAALADRLEWVLDHETEARASADEWRRRELSEFSVDAMIDKTSALYEKLLAERSARRR